MPLPFHYLVLCLVVLTTTACASKTLSQLEGVAKTGGQYTETLKKVNSFALDHSLEFTADLLPELPREHDTLQAQTEVMRKRAQMLSELASYLDTQARYFAELEALAKGDTSAGTSRSLKKLVEALNKSPDLGGITRVSKEAMAGLAGHVADWKHSAEVKAVLIRDADTVSQALLLNQLSLEEQIQWVTRREALARQVEYREKVEKPFVDDKKLSETWKKAWIADIKRPPTIALLEQARQVSLIMQQAWLDVLRGQGGFEHMRASLDQIASNLQAATQP
ncbi:MAG: hypothetical protein O9274_15140 [Limnobacter sp.]|uniref:hypothetical protein n=1 Tax=Limnobacter sp. TaxID=2003368 RepID=UPI0022C863CA|nr:hypothetical protein [Limnobacter sp.]MCZ8017036.1 hypothetical protein [Limnobacter sp.]